MREKEKTRKNDEKEVNLPTLHREPLFIYTSGLKKYSLLAGECYKRLFPQYYLIIISLYVICFINFR